MIDEPLQVPLDFSPSFWPVAVAGRRRGHLDTVALSSHVLASSHVLPTTMRLAPWRVRLMRRPNKTASST
jgi:hypothetical protein